MFSMKPNHIAIYYIKLLSEWYKDTPKEFLHLTFHIFSQRSIESLSYSSNDFIWIITSDRNNLKTFKDKLITNSPELYDFLFDSGRTAQFCGSQCQKILRNYPNLTKPFEDWLKKINAK